jgi:hypothetical protein
MQDSPVHPQYLSYRLVKAAATSGRSDFIRQRDSSFRPALSNCRGLLHAHPQHELEPKRRNAYEKETSEQLQPRAGDKPDFGRQEGIPAGIVPFLFGSD